MELDDLYEVAIRPEREFEGKWGIRLLESGEWIPVTFRTEDDAREAVAAAGRTD
ncbi:MAG: hypothetical protein PGN23_18330 [Sphingomonas adhaesiva]|uniref:hypothetical protein n=1 Tax=Sphingomonas adhaesiva TaxID=28212 RepID=UPI002FF584E8